MPTAVRVSKYRLIAGSPMPARASSATGCSVDPPTSYVLQTFGVEAINVDSWDAIIDLHSSDVMQGLHNFPEINGSTGRPDTAELQAFSEHSYVNISYTGTDLKDTDGNSIFKGSEEHTAVWMDEDDSGLTWL
jgi:hypothetical protein